MADALVSFVLEKLATVIQDEFNQEVHLVIGAEKEVEKLKTTFKQIQAVLNDAEQRQINDEAVKLWLEEFKDIAYDMDDVLDEWSFEIHRSQTDTEVDNNKKKVINSFLYSLCSCFSKVALHHNIGTKIKDIKQRLDLAVSEKHKYRLVEMKSDEKPIERLKSSSLIDVSDIFGRVIDKETIMNKLMFLGESSSNSTNQPESSSIQDLHAPNIISIVGMGGLGKTTLAQLVFNDNQVKTHFEKTMWVCVSDPFDLVTVTKAIIEEAKCEVPKSSEWNTLHRSLSESVKGKRFLLVLDDVWTENRSIWEPLEVSFRYGAKGSRILVTTRNERVAVMMNATYTHFLGVLSDNDCSLLLSRIAFAGRNEKNQHKELKVIGEEISKKCKGLPLAAKTLGGLLHFKKNKKEWSSILESEIWKLEEVENSFLKPTLLLSYYDLPLPLKGCFVYCSIFPKDHMIEKDLLVKLWMAHGFLKDTIGNEEMEMIGEDYFNNLAMRSFFQDFCKDSNGDIISCKMHDLVHDFAHFFMKNECSFTENSGTHFLNSSTRVRHLSSLCKQQLGLSTGSFDHITSSICNARKLRTLLISTYYYNTPIKEVPADLFVRFRCLRVLCLNHIGLENLSSEIENLIHLRYLDLSNNNKLKILPDTISSLYNLQTLKLDGCESLCKLPKEMRNLTNLRHLEIRQTNELCHIPQGISRLTSLRTLSDFIVGDASIGELKNLNLLQGDLNIRGLGKVESVSEALEMQMKQKHLQTLTLGFKPNEEIENGIEQNLKNLLLKRMEDVLEVLEPHPDVVELKVKNYLGFRLSSWLGSTSILSNMKTLRLYDCINLTKFPAFGQLPSLELLEISRAIKVKHIGSEFYTNSFEHVNRIAFPKLQELYLDEMDSLEVLYLEHGVVMPCLTHMRLWRCPKLKALPALGKLPSLEELTIYEVDGLMHVGCEFLYEVGEAGGERLNNKAFPKLETLTLMKTNELELEFGAVPSTGEEIIMPCLRHLSIEGSKNSKPFLEVVSKISSLESLTITGKSTEFIKYIRHDDDDDDLHIAREIRFPNLKNLWVFDMEDMEELKIGLHVMPLLRSLKISRSNKLKAIQGSLSKLEALELGECASLYELPFPNLKRLVLSHGPIHPSLPEAFATTLQALEVLSISCWPTLTCMPKQVQQLTSLKKLELYQCGHELKQRCRKDQGEDWRIISHIPNIYLQDAFAFSEMKLV